MLSLIGSTGSVGRQTLKVLENLNQRPVAIVAGQNAKMVEAQCRQFQPKVAVLANEDAARDLRIRLADTATQVLGGTAAVCEAAAHPEADVTLVAVSGVAGLAPALAAIGSVPRLALANKECIVCAGQLVMGRIRDSSTVLLPVDSELSAIHQCIGLAPSKDIQHITLTASGGPFWGRSLKSMQNVTVDEALRHPTWSMGAKISIDSATLLNKGYEVFETMHCFGIPAEKISVVIHRESIVHAVVQFAYGATFFHMAVPDMKLPIQYALTYPELLPALVERLDLTAAPLTFAKPDLEAFPCLALSIEAARRGGFAGAVLAAAGEAAVERFLAGSLSFTGIAKCLETALMHVPEGEPTSLDDILGADAEARAYVHAL